MRFAFLGGGANLFILGKLKEIKERRKEIGEVRKKEKKEN